MYDPLSTSNKALPVPFSLGYINALWLTLPSTWANYYRSAVWRFVPAVERDYWLHLLDPYLFDDAQKVLSLDYKALRLIHANMLHDESTEPQKMQKLAFSLTVPAGRAWWVGGAPLYRQCDYGLEKLLAPHIVARIDQEADNRLYRKQWGVASAILATQSFVASFAHESGIAITAEVERQQITIIIDDCPFCIQHPNCRVFWGVVLGFLDWLHKDRTVSEIHPCLQVNKAASTAHRVVLDLLE